MFWVFLQILFVYLFQPSYGEDLSSCIELALQNNTELNVQRQNLAPLVSENTKVAALFYLLLIYPFLELKLIRIGLILVMKKLIRNIPLKQIH